MTKLRAPLKRLLDQPLREHDVQRIWRNLQQPARERRVVRARFLLAGASSLLVLSALVWWLSALPSSRPQGALELAGATPLQMQQTFGGERPVTLTLTDGSAVRLERDALLSIVHNDGELFSTRLTRGRGHFSVVKGGPRRWRVHCAEVAVEVVGTRFSVERAARGVRVQVEEGTVSVSGRRVPDGPLLLERGDQLEVPLDAAPTAPEHGTSAQVIPERERAQPALEAPAAEAPAAKAPAADPASKDSTKVASRQAPDYQARSQAAATADVHAELALETLLGQADDARSAGDDARARLLLEQVRTRAPADSVHGALAAFTLGRMELAQHPERAALAFRAATMGPLPVALRATAWARLVEAYAQCGQLERARAAAAHYEREFPSGRELSEVRRFSAGP